MTDGRLPASVYWRRRFVVLGLPLIALVVLVAWALNGRGGDAAAEPPPTSPTSPPPTSGPAVPDCAPPALTAAIAADVADVPVGTGMSFTVTITNAGNTECVLDAGELQREVVISSGSDRIWSSKDCAPADSPARTLLLAPGGTDTTQLAWNQARSAPGCPGELPNPKPGTYQATVSVGGAGGGPVAFRIS